MPVRPFILFDGNAREAIAHYEYVFDTTAEPVVTFAAVPENPDFVLPDEVKQRIWYAHIKIAGDVVMVADIGPFPGFIVGNNVDMFYINPSIDEITKVYGRIMEGGSAQVELDTSAGDRAYANVKDRFGVSWQLSTHDSFL